jgi:hypothetical protein
MALFVRSVLACALSQMMIATMTAPATAQSLVEKCDTLSHNRCAAAMASAEGFCGVACLARRLATLDRPLGNDPTACYRAVVK